MNLPPAFPKMVALTGAALLALWGLSFGLSYVELGRVALPVALSIAAIKAALVVVFFMELLRESLSMRLAMLAAGGLLAILMLLVVADVVLREPAPLVPVGTHPGMPTADLPSR